MNGEDFYDNFKAALRLFGVDWTQKEKVTVVGREGKIVFQYQNCEISFEAR